MAKLEVLDDAYNFNEEEFKKRRYDKNNVEKSSKKFFKLRYIWKINLNDIRVVLSYIPIKASEAYKKVNLRYEKNDFNDRIQIQNELLETLTQIFKEREYIKQEDFNKIVADTNSDIFISILLHILEKRPFSKDTVMVSENGTFQSTEEDRNRYSENSPFHGCRTPPHFVKKPTIQKFDSPTMKRHGRTNFSTNKRKENLINLNSEMKFSDIKDDLNKNGTSVNLQRINFDDDSISEIDLGENIIKEEKKEEVKEDKKGEDKKEEVKEEKKEEEKIRKIIRILIILIIYKKILLNQKIIRLLMKVIN